MSDRSIGRRDFLKRSAGVGAGLMIVRPELVRGSQANSAVRFGLLGCGGRGTDVATGMIKNAGARLVALADLFEDQLTKAKAHFDQFGQIDTSQLFSGPDAHKKIAASKEVDAIYIATPPYFHPEHLETVVNAGKHVYCEKPVAIDVPGTHRVLAAGKKAQGKLSLHVGFQIRKSTPFSELVKRVHAGALGEIVSGEAYYTCPFIDRPALASASPSEARLRNWLYDRALSGDIIVEQNIHVIDICDWTLQGHPVKAVGTGSRRGRTEPGTCWSHFNIVYWYPGDVHVSFSSTQFGKVAFDASERFFGTRGSSQSPYSGTLGISGEEPWTWGSGKAQKAGGEFSATGSFSDNLADADPEKQKAFFGSITSGNFDNQAELGVETALAAMLGRTAAYTGREVTWDELLKSKEVLDPKLDINKLG
jgi:myo-inositol 2-dehydrogenase/D-chiro-inositol 1-dehydrogenase